METREEKCRSELLERLEATDRIVDWDDGFTPSGCNGRKGRMVMDQPRSTPGLVAVVDNVIPDELAQAVYKSAVEAKVWGEYINLKDIDNDIDNDTLVEPGCPTHRRQLAASVVRAVFRERCAHLVAGDWNNVHGVSVWVIASDVGDSVQYHIDYAEMFRFQTNVIYPPMYGGTLHLTPTKDMKGGEFYANLGGLDHYKKFQYKCPIEKFDLDGTGTDGDGSDWIKIPYRYNRATLCDGSLPHFSAPIRSIPDGLKRVIVGFNVCNHEIGPIAEDYPEHSSKFNRFVKLSQTANKFKGGLTVEAVKNNPKLAAFVKFLAKKMKEKQQSEQKELEHERERDSS